MKHLRWTCNGTAINDINQKQLNFSTHKSQTIASVWYCWKTKSDFTLKITFILKIMYMYLVQHLPTTMLT
jgi:hypothetical protein